jgi:hypothetical protein
VKLLLIGGLVGLALGVGLTVFYFALAEFFRVQANAASEAVSELAKKTQEPRGLETKKKAAGLN